LPKVSTLAETFSRFAYELDYAKLPEETRHEAKRRLIDSLGCAMGAYLAEPSKIARRIAHSVHGGATVIGTFHQTSPELAAFANGVLFRYLDYNDTYLSKEPAHPSDNIAALLAVGELADCSGEDLITAIVASYEVQCRLCDAFSIRSKGWDHVTYGSFSTVAGCGMLLGFQPEQYVHAFGLAGVPNNAMRQTRVGELSMWKGCAFANASRNGVFASLLASGGMTGPAPVFEGEMGFFKQVSHEPFEVAPLGGDGYMINRTYIKKYPAEYHSQSAIDAALELRPQIKDPSQIDSILIETFDAAVEIIGGEPEKWRPQSRETADHSLPYCTVVGLVDGEVTQDSFAPARFTDDRLLQIVAKVKVKADPELNAMYPEKGIPNRVTVTLKNGEKLVSEVAAPRGHALNPMTDQEVTAKFLSMATKVLGPAEVDEALERLWSLENERDLTDLLALFAV
jgi:2-methylcitrate dehydratase